MASHDNSTSRRSVITALATIPAVGLVATVPAIAAASTSTAAWDRELAAFRKVEAVHAAAWGRWEQAERQVADSTPDRHDPYFTDYGLFIGTSRDKVDLRLRCFDAVRPGEIDVAQTTDDFMAYQQQILDARERFQTEQLYVAASAHNPAYNLARDALMAVPAPNIAALLIKIEIAGTSLDDDHADAMVADARRLLGNA